MIQGIFHLAFAFASTQQAVYFLETCIFGRVFYLLDWFGGAENL